MTRPSAVIAGGGIVGLATAYQLSRRRDSGGAAWRVTVIEKEPGVARHQSGRNSGVIHSGIYYRPGSVKAQTCATGRRLLQAYCDQHRIAWQRSGKVIVAVEEDERRQLPELLARGRANGVSCELISRGQLREIEPHIEGLEAIRVPEAGVVDYSEVCEALVADLLAAGGTLVTDTRVQRVMTGHREVVVETDRGVFTADGAVNCTGLFSDRLVEASHGFRPPVHILPFRGEYHALRASAAARVHGLVYPVPDARFPFLGVHLTRHIDGRVTVGPNAVLAFAREGYDWHSVVLRDLLGALRSPGLWRLASRYPVTGLMEMWRSVNRRAFLKAARRLMPSLQLEDLLAHPAGVRAQAVDSHGHLADDFRLLRRPRLVHVLNAPSPAATACLAIGQRIASELADACGLQ